MPQKPSLLPGTPQDFLNTTASFGSRRYAKLNNTNSLRGPVEVAQAWGIEPELWDRTWGNLSGGEAQRIALAMAIGLDSAEVILLDGKAAVHFLFFILAYYRVDVFAIEPTSALDPDSSILVEEYLASELRSPESTLKALVWITHSEEQGRRVGTKFIRLSNGGGHGESHFV